MLSFEYKLEQPITYHKNGESMDGRTMTLLAPTYKQRKHCQKLKQLFFKALKPMMDNAKEDKRKSKKDDNPSGSDILNLFFISDVPMEDAMDAFESLLLEGAVIIDGESITKFNLEQVSLKDFEGMFGEYMSNFLAKF